MSELAVATECLWEHHRCGPCAGEGVLNPSCATLTLTRHLGHLEGS